MQPIPAPDTTRHTPPLAPAHDSPDFAALEHMARVLTASGEYQVLQRFRSRTRYHASDADATLRRALFVDVEATGLDTAEDRIIELAAVPFTYDAMSGRVCDVERAFVAFEDPGGPIPDDVVEITGITDDMVRGQRIDDAAVESILRDTALVVAHNARYDRRMLERRFPAFTRLPWACSFADVPWDRLGCRGWALDYLLFQRCAEFFEGHRAEIDCQAAIHVLATSDVQGVVPFRHLLDSARTPTIRVWAHDTPIELKDALRARDYRWHPGDARRERAWYRDCTPGTVNAECTWLESVAYVGRDPAWQRQKITARDRYSTRV